MHVLAIAYRIPAPDQKGDQVVSYVRLARLLGDGHSVHLVCFGDERNEPDRKAADAMRRLGAKVSLVRRNRAEIAANLALAFVTPSMPLQCALLRSRRFRLACARAIEQQMPDVLYGAMARIMINQPDVRARVVVDLIDSMQLNFARRAENARGPARALFSMEARRMGAFERLIADRSDAAFVVSSIDARAIGSARVEVIALGIEVEQFSVRQVLPASPVLIFSGTMSYAPNVEAATWFVRECWSQVKARVPGVKLWIVGGSPAAALKELARRDGDIWVSGRVPSIAELIARASVSIAPMQSGSGMQFKILEAMTSGVPVVSTSLGRGALAAEPGQDLLIADARETFTETVVQLLTDPGLNEEIGRNGLGYVRAHHDWRRLNDRFLSRALGEPNPRSSAAEAAPPVVRSCSRSW